VLISGGSAVIIHIPGHRILDSHLSEVSLFVVAHEIKITYKGFHPEVIHVSLTYILLAK
jgi:hypothetical protein